MTRIWFRDGTYTDVPNSEVHFYLMDRELEYIQPIDKDGKLVDLEEYY